MWTRTDICKSYSLSFRAGIAQAAADEAAMMEPPSPPPEPAANTSTPSRSRRTAAAASKRVRATPKKAAAGVSPRQKSKLCAGGQQEKLVLPDADPSLQPPVEPGVTDTPAPEVVDNTPAELSAAIAAWQQFDEHAKDLLVGKVQSDNMVQLLSSQVEDKQPDQVVMEVNFSILLHNFGSRDTDYCTLSVGCHTGSIALRLRKQFYSCCVDKWVRCADRHIHSVYSPEEQVTFMKTSL